MSRSMLAVLDLLLRRTLIWVIVLISWGLVRTLICHVVVLARVCIINDLIVRTIW